MAPKILSRDSPAWHQFGCPNANPDANTRDASRRRHRSSNMLAQLTNLRRYRPAAEIFRTAESEATRPGTGIE